jgi:hypothetical protein
VTAQEILAEIRMLGGRLEARGDRLHVEAPKGVLTPEHREAVAVLKPELLQLLQQKHDEPSKPTKPSFEGLVGCIPDNSQKISRPEDSWESGELEARLEATGSSIAIDRATGRALLLFKPSDADAVQHVAAVYKPFDVSLTPEQRAELTADLNYYSELESRRTSARTLRTERRNSGTAE